MIRNDILSRVSAAVGGAAKVTRNAILDQIRQATGSGRGYLRFSGLDSYGSLAKGIDIPSDTDFVMEGQLYVESADRGQAYVFGNTSAFDSRLRINYLGDIHFVDGESSDSIDVPGGYVGYFDKIVHFKVERNSIGTRLILDGTTVGINYSQGSLYINAINKNADSASSLRTIIYDSELWVDGVLVSKIAINDPNSNIQQNLVAPANPLTLHAVSASDWFEDVNGKLLGYERKGDFTADGYASSVGDTWTLRPSDGMAAITLSYSRAAMVHYDIDVTQLSVTPLARAGSGETTHPIIANIPGAHDNEMDTDSSGAFTIYTQVYGQATQPDVIMTIVSLREYICRLPDADDEDAIPDGAITMSGDTYTLDNGTITLD